MPKNTEEVIVYNEALDYSNMLDDDYSKDYFEYVYPDYNFEQYEDAGEDEEDEEVSPNDKNSKFSLGLPITANPIYPRIYYGDSSSQYTESEYKDDMRTTWIALVTSIYG